MCFSIELCFRGVDHIDEDLRDIEGVCLLPVLLHPKSRGEIRLQCSDPTEHPIIDPNYLEDPADVQAIVKVSFYTLSMFGNFYKGLYGKKLQATVCNINRSSWYFFRSTLCIYASKASGFHLKQVTPFIISEMRGDANRANQHYGCSPFYNALLRYKLHAIHSKLLTKSLDTFLIGILLEILVNSVS